MLEVNSSGSGTVNVGLTDSRRDLVPVPGRVFGRVFDACDVGGGDETGPGMRSVVVTFVSVCFWSSIFSLKGWSFFPCRDGQTFAPIGVH